MGVFWASIQQEFLFSDFIYLIALFPYFLPYGFKMVLFFFFNTNDLLSISLKFPI